MKNKSICVIFVGSGTDQNTLQHYLTHKQSRIENIIGTVGVTYVHFGTTRFL